MLDVKNIVAGYGQNIVLHNVSFHVQDGENLAIIGPNGCGKTTLLRTIANIIPFEGDVLVDNQNTKTLSRKQLAEKIALFSQITNIYFDYSVYETVMMGRYAKQKRNLLSNYSHLDKEIVREVLETMGLWDIRSKSITALSGGQMQRVLLAKAFVQEPDIILLDEPTNHLDLHFQIELIDFLKRWARNNKKTVIGVLHDINLAIRLSNNILLMADGKIVDSGTPEQVLKSNVLESVYKINIGNYMRESLKIWEKLS